MDNKKQDQDNDELLDNYISIYGKKEDDIITKKKNLNESLKHYYTNREKNIKVNLNNNLSLYLGKFMNTLGSYYEQRNIFKLTFIGIAIINTYIGILIYDFFINEKNEEELD